MPLVLKFINPLYSKMSVPTQRSAVTVTNGYSDSFLLPKEDFSTRIIVYKSHREISLVLALNFFPKKTSPGC